MVAVANLTISELLDSPTLEISIYLPALDSSILRKRELIPFVQFNELREGQDEVRETHPVANS